MRKLSRPLYGQQNKTAYLFLLPWLIGFFCLTLGPMIASLYLSMTKFNLLSSPTWTGLSNYVQILPRTIRFKDPCG